MSSLFWLLVIISQFSVEVLNLLCFELHTKQVFEGNGRGNQAIKSMLFLESYFMYVKVRVPQHCASYVSVSSIAVTLILFTMNSKRPLFFTFHKGQ